MKSKNQKADPIAVTKTAREKSMADVPGRQLDVRNYKQLADIDTIQVAQIAATLWRNGEDKSDAIRNAYEFLDIAEYCKMALKEQSSVEAGIRQYQKMVYIDAEHHAGLQKIRYYEHKRDRNGKRKLIDFDEGLEIAIPLPKATKDKPTERLVRLKRFLKEELEETHPELNEVDRMIEAGNQIERMQLEGIEPNFFTFLRVRFPGWWKEAQARDDRVNGRLGQAVKKRKRRQVKFGSDKRKGARPPIEEFAKSIEIPVEEIEELRKTIALDAMARQAVDASNLT